MGIIVRGRIVRKYCILGVMKTTELEELGKRIRSARISLSWTQEDLAALAEVDRSYVGGVERGERNISFDLLCKLCSALGCDIAALTKEIPEVKK